MAHLGRLISPVILIRPILTPPDSIDAGSYTVARIEAAVSLRVQLKTFKHQKMFVMRYTKFTFIGISLELLSSPMDV